MSSPGTEWLIRPLESITEIDAEQWNRCANPADAPYNPFIDHRYLHALEASASAVAETGWQPFHLLLTDPQDNVLGAMPLYVKGHSQGEYVFDHAWADALARAGGRYYPKLQSCVPFTPATGRRLLIPACDDQEQRARALLTGACQVADQIEVSSLHMTFMPEAQWRLADECGLLRRMDQQFHWENQGFATFDEFLAALNSKSARI